MRQIEDYDAMLVYNDKDWDEVKVVARILVERGLRPWVDKQHLRPGLDFQDELERVIEHIRTACVFVGASGAGPWQRAEIRAILSEFTRRNLPVIPVLLPSCPQAPQLPLFLRMFGWVRFAETLDDTDALDRLRFGITGNEVSPITTAASANAARRAAAARRLADLLGHSAKVRDARRKSHE
jgi:hypothetical protein